MAKQVGPLFITGTIDGIIFYKLGDQYYMRSKGDYKSGKQMRKDPRLKRTMQNADRFGRGSKLVKYIYYRHVPKEVRKPGLYGKLTGMVNRWLYQEKSQEEVQSLLIAYCKDLVKGGVTASAEIKSANTVNSTVVKSPIILPVKAIPVVAKKPVLHAPAKVVKRARYLPKQKVKADGRQQVPNLFVNQRASHYNYLDDAHDEYCTAKLPMTAVL